eukprot:682870-Pyramimonas_sp.AAC.1
MRMWRSHGGPYPTLCDLHVVARARFIPLAPPNEAKACVFTVTGTNVIANVLADPRHPGAHMSLKAAECSTLLPFAVYSLEKHGGASIFGCPLMGAGHALVKLADALKSVSVVPTKGEMHIIRNQLDLHMACAQSAGIGLTPKHHLMCHLIHRTLGITVVLNLVFLSIPLRPRPRTRLPRRPPPPSSCPSSPASSSASVSLFRGGGRIG